MDDTIEIEFVSHCEDKDCTLGYAAYKCPSCNKTSHDYGELWWNHDSPKVTDNFCKSYCDMCGTDYLMTKTKDFNIYKIEKI